MREISVPFIRRTRWTSHPNVNIKGLSSPQNIISIKLPKNNYRIGGKTVDNSVLKLSFFIHSTITGTPTEVIKRLVRERLPLGGLYKYIEGNNEWLLSREICVLNGQVAFILVPFSQTPRFYVGANLMMATSRLAKAFKEKIIPDAVLDNNVVEIMDTYEFTFKRVSTPTEVISSDNIRDILLEKLDLS